MRRRESRNRRRLRAASAGQGEPPGLLLRKGRREATDLEALETATPEADTLRGRGACEAEEGVWRRPHALEGGPRAGAPAAQAVHLDLIERRGDPPW